MSNPIKQYLSKVRTWRRKHSVFSVLVVLLGVVLAWRGLWGLLDLYFFPDNQLLSYILSFILGVIVLYIDDFKISELE